MQLIHLSIHVESEHAHLDWPLPLVPLKHSCLAMQSPLPLREIPPCFAFTPRRQISRRLYSPLPILCISKTRIPVVENTLKSIKHYLKSMRRFGICGVTDKISANSLAFLQMATCVEPYKNKSTSTQRPSPMLCLLIVRPYKQMYWLPRNFFNEFTK